MKTYELEAEFKYDKILQPLIQGTRLAALYDALEKNRALQGKLKGVMEKVSLALTCVIQPSMFRG